MNQTNLNTATRPQIRRNIYKNSNTKNLEIAMVLVKRITILGLQEKEEQNKRVLVQETCFLPNSIPGLQALPSATSKRSVEVATAHALLSHCPL